MVGESLNLLTRGSVQQSTQCLVFVCARVLNSSKHTHIHTNRRTNEHRGGEKWYICSLLSPSSPSLRLNCIFTCMCTCARISVRALLKTRARSHAPGARCKYGKRKHNKQTTGETPRFSPRAEYVGQTLCAATNGIISIRTQ